MELISILIGYLIGSFPTGFVLLKILFGKDIRKEGSGNVGGRNTYETTGKLYLGIIVGITDAIKGLIPVLLFKNYYNLELAGYAFVGAVLGHCYSVWIKFKGGRGLGTAAGGFLILMWPIIIFWLVGYAIVGKFTRSVHVSIVGAVVTTALLVYILNQNLLLEKNNYLITSSVEEMKFYFSLIGLVVISTCIEPIKDFIKTGHAI